MGEPVTPNEHHSDTPIHLPLLDRVKPAARKECLTPDELIDETKAFMESFKPAVDSQQSPDTVFFLLKSAAPVGNLFKKLWPSFYPDTPTPAVRYVNIGRKNPSEFVPSFNEKTFTQTLDYIPPDIEAPPVEKIQEVFGKSIKGNGNIVLVDEWSETGGSIQAAQATFEKAFPQAKISSGVVYSKRPHWVDVPNDIGLDTPSYLGIQDVTEWDKEKEALHRVNQHHSREDGFTPFSSEQDMRGSFEGVRHIPEYFRHMDNLNESVYGVKKPEPFDREIFDLAREEQETIYTEVLRRAHLPVAA